jgi:hypothetical protein
MKKTPQLQFIQQDYFVKFQLQPDMARYVREDRSSPELSFAVWEVAICNLARDFLFSRIPTRAWPIVDDLNGVNVVRVHGTIAVCYACGASATDDIGEKQFHTSVGCAIVKSYD